MSRLFTNTLASEINSQVANILQPELRKTHQDRGIVICGGGYKYFANACLVGKLLTQFHCVLPRELWITNDSELNSEMRTLAESLGFSVRTASSPEVLSVRQMMLPGASRWQWVLKPYAIIHSRFSEVLYLDADSFPTRDPSYLFESAPYREHGAVFWPDVRVTGKDNPIWEVTGVPFRHEPEFETGQMVIDKRRCWEPLQLALWMNRRADQFYSMIWGDKDTFRFAWHKYGRAFGLVPHQPQPMSFPGSGGVAGLWQHDFDGNWLFQHRNMAKWDLLGENPRIPGYLHEPECRRFLRELRSKWNGWVADAQSGQPSHQDSAYLQKLRKDLTHGVWLLEDRRPRAAGCCGPAVAWTKKRPTAPWAQGELADSAPAVWKGPRYTELSFLVDSIGIGAQKGLYWWSLRHGQQGVQLDVRGEEGVSTSLRQQADGTWLGAWKRKAGEAVIKTRLMRPEQAFPEGQKGAASKAPVGKSKRCLHVAQHTHGIGDAILGLYVVAGLARKGQPILYHTQQLQWLSRVQIPAVTFTDEVPPPGTCDLGSDYDDQMRYGQRREGWYAMQAAMAGLPQVRPTRPRIDLNLRNPVMDMDRYVLLAPFAAWQRRDWTQGHWRRLAHLLVEAGYEVVAIGTKQDEERLKETFDKSHAYWVVDQTPEWVMSAMLGAQAVIGLDSGMIHVAGLLGVPAVCIHSHLPPKFLFSQAPSVVSVTPETSCVFCRWQHDRGYNEGCDTACSALATVSSEQVMAAVQSPKIAVLRAKLQKAVARDTKRALAKNSHAAPPPPTIITTNEVRPDVIAYTYKADCGLGEAAAMNIKAMRDSGLTVEHRIWNREVMIQEAALNDPQQIYYHHWHPQPGEHTRDWKRDGFLESNGAYHIAYWAYEIEKGLPAEFMTAAPVMREIWTPSHFCQGLFRETNRPVHVIPHAVPSVAKLTALPAAQEKAPFTVLSLFDAWSRFARKNPQAVIRVFQKAFPRRLNVRLVLKGHHMSEEELQSLKAGCGWDPRITIINRFLSFEELEKLFASADVFLSMQRGEGFGLNLARSLGRGLPVITTGWSGNLDFCKPNNSFLVPYKMRKVETEADKFYVKGMWANPDEKMAATLLKRVAEMVAQDDRELKRMRERGRKLIATKFNEQVLCDRIKERIAAIRLQQAQRLPIQL